MERWALPGVSRQVLEKAHMVVVPGVGAMAWQRVGKAALALGDPLAPPEYGSRILRAYLDTVDSQGLYPVLAPISDRFQETCTGAGLSTLPLGKEANVDLAGFHLRGNAHKRLRQGYGRGLREGVSFRYLEPPVSPAWMAAMASVSDAWLKDRPLGELKIGLGWFDSLETSKSPIGAAVDRNGRLVSFVTLHGYASPSVGFDLLRRHPAAPKGSVEVLLVESLLHLKRAGYRRASLGLAPLTDPEWPARGLKWLGKHIFQYDCQGLERFKNKFQPQWNERHVAYASKRGILEVLATGVRGFAFF